ncbi:MAG: YraN family protein [Myxococcota bacterium]
MSKESTGSTRPSPRQRLGRAGEASAARFLESRGYRIIARNVRADRVEIDLVARRGPLLVFVEVKSRNSDRHGSPAEAVDRRKQQRLRRGARAWLASEPAAARGYRRLRFDVVTCLRVGPRGSQEPRPRRSPGPARFGAWVQDESTAPDRARWWIEHWEAAF